MANQPKSPVEPPSTKDFEEIDARLKKAFPEIDIQKFGEKMAAVGGAHNLEEKWASLVRQFEFWMDMARTYKE